MRLDEKGPGNSQRLLAVAFRFIELAAVQMQGAEGIQSARHFGMLFSEETAAHLQRLPEERCGVVQVVFVEVCGGKCIENPRDLGVHVAKSSFQNLPGPFKILPCRRVGARLDENGGKTGKVRGVAWAAGAGLL